jgi:peptidoglycan/xylan/chitin deacetylase (PgdA/CDA1 family)
MKKIFKNVIFWLLNIFWLRLGKKSAILMYHSIGDNPAYFTVKPGRFKSQLEYIKKGNYRVIFLSELVRKLKAGADIGGYVCLTFDDGYEDFYQNAFPLLKEFGFPATVFLPTGKLGATMTNNDQVTLNLMTSEQIKELSRTDLVEFMPHTHNHPSLDKVSILEAINEMEQSRDWLINNVKGPADILAYPRGKFTNEVVNYLKNHGWSAGVTVKEGLVDKHADPLSLKRNSIDSTTNLVQFKGKISPAVEIYEKLKFNFKNV